MQVLIIVIGGLVLADAEATHLPPTGNSPTPFFAAHCIRCHGPKKQKGTLRVDTLVVDFKSGKVLAQWEEIMNRINSGDMPPEGEPSPDPDEAAQVVDWIAIQLREAEAARQAASGERVAFRKLSRDEYANTIRDLLGVEFDVKGPAGLPEDPDWNGFERIGSTLNMSPAHVEKYLGAAEVILDEALSLGSKPTRQLVRWEPFDMRWGPSEPRWKSLAKEYQERGLAKQVRIDIVPRNGGDDTWRLDVAYTGEYLLRVQLSGLRPEGGRVPRLKVYLPDINKTLLEQNVDAPEDQPAIVEGRVHLPAGRHAVRIINAVPGPNPEARRSRNNNTPVAFTTMRSRVPWQLKLSDDDFKPIEPTLLVDMVEWDGPIVDAWPTVAHRSIFFRGEQAEQDVNYAREIVSRFAERAWRRPAQAAEVERMLQPFEKARQLGDDFGVAVKGALVAVLCAKSFLYLEEGNASTPVLRISDRELASRLSYFLWSTQPDQRLIDLADAGRLHETETLGTETRRMLQDPRASDFAEAFPYQWLQLRKVGMFAPDKVLYPDYDESLERSLVAETVGYFADVLQRNGSLREFLDSDWTLLNERLAAHYGVNGVRGDQLRPVSLKPGHHRGGLLTQAAILSLTSDGTRHRPVHRGVWILESIMGQPPPPPPANVPALDIPATSTRKHTVRELLEAHRANPNCTACHQKIDPLGLAFENYDAIGRWRTIETVRSGTGDDPELDPSGSLPDGRKFADSRELKQLLLADIDKFAIAFTEKLATYALRRGMTFSDREELKRIAGQTKGGGYRLATLIEALVMSDLFQTR